VNDLKVLQSLSAAFLEVAAKLFGQNIDAKALDALVEGVG